MSIKIADGRRILKEFRFFNVVEYEKEAEYLRERSRNGWRLLSVGSLGSYKFEECEPQDVVYQLDYNREGIQHKDEYIQMFEDCGWEYIQDYMGYSYFRKAAEETEEENQIFCDDASRLDMMKRVFRGRIIPMILIFICVIFTNIINPISSGMNLPKPYILLVAILVIVYVVIFVKFAIAYGMFVKRMNRT